ncbi:MAG: hypothetical protein V3T83_02685 [Acidobacteriota bacterium]
MMNTKSRFRITVTLTAIATALGLAFVLSACSSGEPEPAGVAELAESADTSIRPVPFPPGFNVPTDQSTVEGWVSSDPQNTEAMFRHAWDIWNGLMQPTDEADPNGNRNLAVFETWLSAPEIFDPGVGSAADVTTRRLRPFQSPRQASHANLAPEAISTDPEQVIAFVKYDPFAAEFTFLNQYNKASTLIALQASWTPQTPIIDREIKQFTNHASMALKPTYYLVKQTGLTSLPVWPGPPSPSMAFGPTAWDTCVLVDPTNQQGGSTVQGDCNGITKDLSVFNVNDFHHQQLTEEEASNVSELKGADNLKGAQAGDYAVLVAMHVTSKELPRWTWQTFWWSPTPDDPKHPSSSEAAGQRPPSLPPPASHYATCTAYSMVIPAQPITKGTNLCVNATDLGCLFCYNPYLEAGFGNFSTSENPKFGVNTNCMACHGNANWGPLVRQPKPGYVGDQYDDPGGQIFGEVTKVDFLWSIPDNAK